jgi:hypothetical protein
MALIRHIRIQNFRGIHKFDWFPSDRVNCLIGPGDSGKTTVLDAIDFCLNPRRYASISENDFHTLNTDEPILIELTLGSLEDELLKLDSYLNFIRGFEVATKTIQDEPGGILEPVLTVRLEVADDLLPKWRLYSERTEQNGEMRDLNFKDRNAIGPTRLGSYADSQLAWGQRSILNRIGTERPNAGKALASARREARGAFISKTGDTFKNVLDIVREVAGELAVDVGEEVKAILDTSEVAIVNGAVSLHDSRDIPLRSLGLGSSRLLVPTFLRVRPETSRRIAEFSEHEAD